MKIMDGAVEYNLEGEEMKKTPNDRLSIPAQLLLMLFAVVLSIGLTARQQEPPHEAALLRLKVSRENSAPFISAENGRVRWTVMGTAPDGSVWLCYVSTNIGEELVAIPQELTLVVPVGSCYRRR